MEIIKSSFSKLGCEKSLRFDLSYLKFALKNTPSTEATICDLFDIIDLPKIDIESLTTIKYCQIGDVDNNGNSYPVELDFENPSIALDDYFKKILKGDIIKPEIGDIIISKVRPYLKKFVLIDDTNKDIYYTSAFICLRPKFNNLLQYYSIRSCIFPFLNSASRQGKGYPTLNPSDIRALKIETSIVEKMKNFSHIEEITNKHFEINKKTLSLVDKIVVINDVFAKEFGFEKDIYKTIGKGMSFGTQNSDNKKLNVFKTSFSSFSNSRINRFSVRFHNTIINKLNDYLLNIPHIKIEDIAISNERGVQPIYDMYGEIPVVKIANMKNGIIDLSDAECINEEYWKSVPETKKLKPGDIIICCTGKCSLGKIEIFDEKVDSITAADNIVFKIDSTKYNPQFLVFFLKSILGYYQIERDYTGTTNQIHLYWDQIKKFMIPDISLKEQERIVKEINLIYEEQNKVLNEINCIRNSLENKIKKYLLG